MRQKKTIGSSIGLLTGAVIANLALVRGTWQVPLLIGTFAVWGLWLLCTQVFPPADGPAEAGRRLYNNST